MAYSRRLGVLGIVGVCCFVAVACSDDEDRKGNMGDAGDGGDEGGGKAGTPSVGGSSNMGGKAGMSGGGTAGSAAGDAGSGGTAGDAGSGSGGDAGGGGIVAGAGGEGGSGVVGGGGEGGLSSGGEGGTPAAPVAKSCVDVCEDDDDCVDGGGFPKNCNDVTQVCDACVVDADCDPEPSLWLPGCETTDECDDPLFVCVDYRGNAYCAVVDDPQNGAGCADLGDFEATTATLREGGANISVCVAPHQRCFDGKCDVSCESFDTCPAKEGDTCNPVSGRCECQNGTECGDGLVCVDSRCTECATDDDCLATAAADGHDTCVAGKCGCADATSCNAGLFPAATNACQ